MRRVLIGLGVALVVACTPYVKKDSVRIYSNTNMKQSVLAAVSALKNKGFSIQSTTSPADGVTIMNAKRQAAFWDPQHFVELTVNLYEVSPGQVSIEANSMMANSAFDGGFLDSALTDFYSEVDRRLASSNP